MKKIVNVKKFVVSTTILFLLILLGGSALVNATYSCNKIDYKTKNKMKTCIYNSVCW